MSSFSRYRDVKRSQREHLQMLITPPDTSSPSTCKFKTHTFVISFRIFRSRSQSLTIFFHLTYLLILQHRKRTHTICQVRLQIQRLRSLGLPRIKRMFPTRSSRLSSFIDCQIHSIGIGISRKIRILFLLF